MLTNIGVDAAAGSIPVLGDVFDIYFKANRRNLRLVLVTSVSIMPTSTNRSLIWRGNAFRAPPLSLRFSSERMATPAQYVYQRSN